MPSQEGSIPLHVGHVCMIREAKKLGDKLVVIVNNDNWLKKKKGYAFMPEQERVEILKALRDVDDVILSCHVPGDPDRSVCRELEKLMPDIFANSDDRFEDNIPEAVLCRKLGIRMVDNVGGQKANSSSELVKKATSKK